MDSRPELLLTLDRLERRRGETWQGLWLAPLLTILAQAFLLLVLADENIGWLGRAAVLAAALAAALAAIWSVLRAHAREVQYSEAIAERTASLEGEHADPRPAALARPRRRPPAAAASAAAPAAKAEPEPDSEDSESEEPEVAAAAGPDGEGETEVLDAAPPPRSTPRAEEEDEDDEEEPREDWVRRWDRHLTWWASGESHAKAYMAWTATLALFVLADVAVYLATV